jgi:DNA modification methylase
MPGAIIHGDNLTELRRMSTGSVALVYADPPFRTGDVFRSTAGVIAYSDRWVWTPDEDALLEAQIAQTNRGERHAARVLLSLLEAYGRGPDGAYLVHLAARVTELHRVLSSTGVLVLHLDDTIAHLARVLLDATFGRDTFVNEIVWRYRRWPAPGQRLQRMHDTLLVYARSPGTHTFHTLHGYEQLAESTQRTHGSGKQRAIIKDGRRVRTEVTDEQSAGPVLSDVWDIPVIAPRAHERTGYPTQKPEALLERIILSFSNEGDTVLDPYCGSGTTLAVAEKNRRAWVGVDASDVAIETSLRRLGVAVSDVRTAMPNRQAQRAHASSPACSQARSQVPSRRLA